jgi:hypothetical protein
MTCKKNMKTKSELLFEKYCKSEGYTSVPIPAGPEQGKTPDYWVCCGDDKIIAEIKELSPNSDDKLHAEECKKQGWTLLEESPPGKRIYNAITDGAKQLAQFKHQELPCVLILYDNIVVDGERLRPSQLLEPSLLDFGMYGLQKVILSVRRPSYDDTDIRVTGNGRGGKRRMTSNTREYISAVSILCEGQNGEEPYLYSFHNWFANIPLPQHLFRGPNDRHFAKPDHPDKCLQKWEEI